MARTAKKQIEIPGAERASIPEVDSRVVAYVRATDELARLKEEVKAIRADLAWALRNYSGDMDRNSDGDPVYTFVDGDAPPIRFVLAHREQVVMLRAKGAEEL